MPPAHVGGDAHPVGPSRKRLVDVVDVVGVLVGIAADARDVLALLGVVEIGEARVVELEICAAELTEALHLIPVRSRQVVPELLDIRVDVLADRCRPPR